MSIIFDSFKKMYHSEAQRRFPWKDILLLLCTLVLIALMGYAYYPEFTHTTMASGEPKSNTVVAMANASVMHSSEMRTESLLMKSSSSSAPIAAGPTFNFIEQEYVG